MTPIATLHRPTRDVRVSGMSSLTPPAELLAELPLPDRSAELVLHSRDEVERILNGEDDRLMLVVGPCSVHDPEAGIEYARLLANLATEVAQDVVLVMRLYFEKPRTTVGWKGLINDPYLDGSYAVNDGLRISRKLLLDVLALGIPVGCEFLDPISPQYISDAVTWGAIGARTSESQVHRSLASGLSMPVGFKNSTDGRIGVAIDAIRTAAHSHSFFGVTEDGRAAIVTTAGNEDCHVVLRGGTGKPNHGAESVQHALATLRKAGLPERLVIDASHDNSGKDHTQQPAVADQIAAQVAGGERGIVGVMLESFLVEGRQNAGSGKADLVYGQSITDACMGWGTTVPVVHALAEAARERRRA
ncbi:MAG TPA: 3-deoxy-7-phosphoheptulonate synthase [Chloroflexota bacterium]|nr:3-deoxy-7-phosphoheptulonate synthase [Chloroflexota bacterium]